MTTTAATTSASPSLSNDSPPIQQEDNGASGTKTSPIPIDRQPQQNQPNNSEHSSSSSSSSSSSPPPQPQPSSLPLTQPSQVQQPDQSPPHNSDHTSSPSGPGTPEQPQTLASTSSSSSSSSSTTTTTLTSAITECTDEQEQPPQQNQQQTPSSQQSQSTNSKSNDNHELKRPMNAFFLYCQKQRSLVREQNPNLENRGITKILGEWWAKLDKEQKSEYTDLARKEKDAYMKANPDFKWCKPPNVSNINNNNNCNSNNSSNSHDCYPNNSPNHQQHLQKQLNNHNSSSSSSSSSTTTTTTNAELLSLQSVHHHLDGLHHSSNSMDITLTSRQQIGAPKPPKKRFLERNDSIYTNRNSFASNHETNSHGADVVPYISLDQDTLDRVIDKAFSEDSNNSPSGTNTCKCSNRTSTNLTSSSLGTTTNQTSFSSSSSSAAYTAMNVDEPIDFSTNRTFNTTRQQIINNLVEKMLSEPTDNASSFSKINGTFSVKSQAGPPVKKDNPDDT